MLSCSRCCLTAFAVFLTVSRLNAAEFQPAAGGMADKGSRVWIPASHNTGRIFVKEPVYKNGTPLYLSIPLGDSFDSLIAGALDGATTETPDTLYLDANNNGDLTDDTPLPLRKADVTDRKGELYTDPVKVRVKYFCGTERTFRMVVSVRPSGDKAGRPSRLYCWTLVDHLEGRVDIGDKKGVLMGLYDAPGELKAPNGCFADIGVDHVRIDLDGDNKLDAVREDFLLNEFIGYADKLWSIRTDSEVSDIRLSPSNLVAGKLLISLDLKQGGLAGGVVEVACPKGRPFLCDLASRNPVPAPTNIYRMVSRKCLATNMAGEEWSFEFATPTQVVVKVGEVTTAKLGSPIKVEPLWNGAAKRGKKLDITARVTGATGEEYGRFECDDKAQPPYVKILNAKDAVISEGNMEYG